MLRLSAAPARVFPALLLAFVATLAMVFLTGQSGPTKPIPVFGVDPAVLDEYFGILVYPPDGAPSLSAEDAIAAAQQSDGEGAPAGVQLVHLKLVYEGFEGLVWVVKWDVDGKEAVRPVGLPEAAQEPPWRFVFNLTFIDAETGAFVTGVELTTPLSDLERARQDVVE